MVVSGLCCPLYQVFGLSLQRTPHVAVRSALVSLGSAVAWGGAKTVCELRMVSLRCQQMESKERMQMQTQDYCNVHPAKYYAFMKDPEPLPGAGDGASDGDNDVVLVDDSQETLQMGGACCDDENVRDEFNRPLTINMSGHTCLGWSDRGNKQGVGHADSAKAFATWTADLQEAKNDFDIAECTATFPPKNFKELMSFHVLHVILNIVQLFRTSCSLVAVLCNFILVAPPCGPWHALFSGCFWPNTYVSPLRSQRSCDFMGTPARLKLKR